MGNSEGKRGTGPELTETEIEILLANTNYTREQINKWYYGFLADCPNGKLNKKKFEEIYEQLYSNQKAGDFSNYVFEVFDEDGNGVIDFSEFLYAISALSDGDLTRKLHLTFRIYDVNGNKQIDRKEMEKILKTIYDLKGVPKDQRTGENSVKSRVEQIFQKLDRNDSEILTEDEFVEGCLADPGILSILLPNTKPK